MGRRAIALLALLAMVCVFPACTAAPDTTVVSTFTTGQFGRARVALHEDLPNRPEKTSKIDRNYLLAHMRVGILTLADGYPEGASGVMDEVYDILRLQGINRDQTVTSVVLNEDLKIWKGEPFEQALAYSYVAAQYASQGSWDNARAAISGAMFHLRDFGTGPDGQPLGTEAVVTRASNADPDSDVMPAYQVDESNFALGHLLSALASQQLGRTDEANAHYEQAVRINAQLGPLAQALARGDYNTLLMVDYGQGPQKVGVGPDQAIASFRPIMPSDGAFLRATVNGQEVRVPVVCDVNAMARDHRWNNLEDMRVAKSTVGSALMIGGGVLAAKAHNEEAQLVGLGLLLAGAVAKAGAHADTRYCEAMPQRVYLLPLNLAPGQVATLAVEGHPGAQMIVTGAGQDMSEGSLQFRYVRLLKAGVAYPWTVTPRVVYSNVHAQAVTPLNFPFILGGHCVRPPTPQVLASYQASGFLRDMTFNQLRDLYLEEEIVWEDSPLAFPGLHVLEGGRSLASPWPGTTGYQRLFCGQHPPYVPKSSATREWAARVAQQLNQATPHTAAEVAGVK